MKRLILTGIFMLAVTTNLDVPPKYIPWHAIDLRDNPGPFTEIKLARLRENPAACHTALREAGIQFQPLADNLENSACLQENMISLQKSGYPYSSAIKANCGLVAALILWEAHVVGPAAQEYGSPVTSIEHLGVLSCRNVRGSETRMSQHATANAIDINSFRFANGKRADLETDWGKDTPEGKFLQTVRDGSCAIFRGVLGPDYNILHRDHFHLDRGQFNICR